MWTLKQLNMTNDDWEDYLEYIEGGYESFFIGKNMSYLNYTLQIIKYFNQLLSDDMINKLTNFIKFYLAVAIIDIVLLIVMIYIAFRVISVTECKNIRVLLLVIFINLTLITHITQSLYMWDN